MTSKSLAQNMIPLSWVSLPDVLASLCLGYLADQRTTYFPDGQIKSIAYYVNGKLHGEYKEWHPRYIRLWLKCQGNYDNGKKHGDWTYWYQGGDVKKRMSYIHGKRHGDWKKWDCWGMGRIDLHVIYDHGKKIKGIVEPPETDLAKWFRMANDTEQYPSDSDS